MIKLYRDSDFSDPVVKSVGPDDIDQLLITQFLPYTQEGLIGVTWEVDRDADNRYHITLERDSTVFFDEDVEGMNFEFNTGSNNRPLILTLVADSPYFLPDTRQIVLIPENKGIGTDMIFGSEIQDEDHVWFVVGGEQLYEGVGTIGYRVGMTLTIG